MVNCLKTCLEIKCWVICWLSIIMYLTLNNFVVSKVKTQIGSTVTISWTAPFFPYHGQYEFYHTHRKHSTIFSIKDDRIFCGIDVLSPKYTYLTRPLNSTNMMFEIRNITLDDTGFLQWWNNIQRWYVRTGCCTHCIRYDLYLHKWRYYLFTLLNYKIVLSLMLQLW